MEAYGGGSHHHSLAVEKKWRPMVEGRLDISTHFLICLLLLYTTHINTHYVLLLVLTAPMYTMLPKISEHTIPCCTQIGSTSAFFDDIVTLHRRTLQQIFR